MVTTVGKQEGVNEHFTDILTLCQILYGTDRSCTLSKKLMTGLSANHKPPRLMLPYCRNKAQTQIGHSRSLILTLVGRVL